MIREWWYKLRRVGGRQTLDDDLREEIEAHLEMEVEENLSQGMSVESARTAAIRKFGNPALVQEKARDSWVFRSLEDFLFDVRFALRAFRKSPSFALTVVVTLALGLGALAASFSMFNAVVLRPFAVRDPYSLYGSLNWTSFKAENVSTKQKFTWREFLDFRRENGVFSEVLGYQNGIALMAGKRANIQAVTGNYFSMLGGRICMGRALLESDDAPGAAVAVASNAAWKSRFGSNTEIIGTKMRIGERSVEIIGVACPEFAGPQIERIDFWVSLALSRELMGDIGSRGLFNLRQPGDSPELSIIGRLKPGLTRENAEAALLSYGRRQYLTWRDWNQPPDRLNIQRQATVFPLNSRSMGFFMPFFLLFGLVLLIACANVSNMMLARGLARRREIGIRISLGAGRLRMVRQILTESLLLAIPAAMAAFGVAYAIIRMTYWLLTKILPDFMMEFILADFNLPSFSPDLRVVAFLFATAIITALVFGLAPAMQAARSPLVQVYRGEFETGHRHARLRSAMVIVQATLCALLLILSGVAMRNQMRTASLDLKLDTCGVFLIETYPKYRQSALARLSSLPGVDSIGTCFMPPLYYPNTYHPKLVGEDGKIEVSCAPNWVSPEYFDVYKIAVKGRKDPTKYLDITKGQLDGTEAVISETAARRLFASGSALGRTLEEKRFDKGSGRTIVNRYPVVGVAADSVFEIVDWQVAPDPQHQAVVYFLGPSAEKHVSFDTIVVRMKGNPGAARLLLQKALAETTPGETHFKISSARDEWDVNLWPYSALAGIAGFLGAIALLMTMSGIFGMLSYMIMQRRKEFGIRIALGADKACVTGMVFRQSLKLAASGSVVGAFLALAVTRVLASNFYLFNAGGYAAGVLVVLAAALTASWIPARKAVNLDPARTLRCD
jgi:predicted permease